MPGAAATGCVVPYAAATPPGWGPATVFTAGGGVGAGAGVIATGGGGGGM